MTTNLTRLLHKVIEFWLYSQIDIEAQDVEGSAASESAHPEVHEESTDHPIENEKEEEETTGTEPVDEPVSEEPVASEADDEDDFVIVSSEDGPSELAVQGYPATHVYHHHIVLINRLTRLLRNRMTSLKIQSNMPPSQSYNRQLWMKRTSQLMLKI
jgi:hypothetical protein